MNEYLSYETFLDKNVFYTYKEVEEVFSKSLCENTISSLIVKDEAKYLSYKNDNLITVNGEVISKNLLRDLLEDEGMYRYLKGNASNNLEYVAEIVYVDAEVNIESIKVSSINLISFFNEIYFELSDKGKMRAIFLESLLKENKTFCDGKYIENNIVDLMRFLSKEMNANYSNLEKAIYYFIKLCEICSSDSEYYFENDDILRELYNKVRDNVNIKSDLDDFFGIYLLVLSVLKLKYTLQDDFKLDFNYLEYSIVIDFEDIKNNFSDSGVIQKMSCLKVNNESKVTKKKFEELKNKLYEDIIEQRKIKHSFEENMMSYNNLNKITDIQLKERLFVFLKEISRFELRGIDKVQYIRSLFNLLFRDNKNVSLEILAKKTAKLNYLTLVSVISVDSKYLVVDSGNSDVLSCLDKVDLDEYMSKNIYFSIDRR